MTDINLIKRNEQPTPLSHAQVDSNWQTIEDAVNELNDIKLEDAPNDGKQYARKNKSWSEVVMPNSGGIGDNSRYIISGFPIWSGVGLEYLYPHINYVWNGVELTAPQGSITLDTSDVSFDRFDLIVLSEDGTVSVIKGTASDNPIIPTLPNDRLLLLTINVKVGMTEPNVISEIIYNENIEWATSILLKNHPNIPDDLGSIDFDSTNEFKVGAKSIHWNTNEKKIAIFKPSSLIDPTEWTSLSMWIMLKEAINDGRRFEFQFFKNAGNVIGNYIDILTKGLNKNLLNEWQLITIPIADFNIPNGEQIERLRATFTLGSPSVVRDLYIDYIRLTTDVEQVIEPPKEFNVSVNGQLIGAVESINFIEDENIEINGTLNDKTADISIRANVEDIQYPNITLQPNFAGFKFFDEDVYSIYIEDFDFANGKLSDYNIGIGVEVHRANVLDACGESQGVVIYYTLGDNICKNDYSYGYSSGGNNCIKNFHSEDDMIDYIYYNNNSCIETIEWTGTQIGSKFINDFGINANVLILNCQKLTSVKLEYVTEMSDIYGYISNPLLIEILTPLLANVGGDNAISNNNSLTTIDQSLLASVGGDNSISYNTSLTTIDQSLLASIGGYNYINSNNSLTTIDQPLLANVGGDNYISSNTSLTTIDQPLLASIGGYNYINSNNSLTTIDQPLLANVGGDNYISYNNSLTTIDQPLLASVGENNDINSNNSLTTIDQPLLASIGEDNYINGNNSLTTIDQPLLASIGGYNSISYNNSLTTIIVAPTLTFTNLNNNNQIHAYYNNNALNQTTVDAICDAILAGSTLIPIDGAYLAFDGGTNAIPGGTRITDLQNAGWTVMTNL